MSVSSLSKFVRAVAVNVFCALLLAGIARCACAREPDAAHGIIRTFAVSLDPASPDLDFLSDESLAVVVTAPEQNPESFAFTSANSDSRFDSTVWVLQPALHITTNGATVPGSVSWLVTPDTPDLPPPGAITFTGADSPLVCSQELVYVQDCNAGTCEDYSPSRIKRFVSTPGNGFPMLVVTAVFSR